MLIGHLPCTYILCRLCAPRRAGPRAFAAVLAGSVAPDLDMLWWLFVDAQSRHHHDCLTHRPILWMFALVLGMTATRGTARQYLVGMSIGGLGHMILDSIAGRIAWLWPATDWARPLIAVPATHMHWVESFVTHWTFEVELALCALALHAYLRSSRAMP